MAESALRPDDLPPAVDGLIPYVSPPPGPALDAILAEDVEKLPVTDGKLLPDARLQRTPLEYSRSSLRLHFADRRDDVSVDGDMFVYYVGRDDDGEPTKASVAPDIFVVFGVPDDPKRSRYVLYEEPDADIRFVLEIASPSTRSRDYGTKRKIYAHMGVDEYFLFDPPTKRRPARVVGLTLRGPVYHDMRQSVLPNGHRGVLSEVLGLAAYCRDGALRWFDPVAEDLVDLSTSVRQTKEEARQKEEAQHRAKEEARQKEEARRQARQFRAAAAKARQEAAAARSEVAAAMAKIAELEALLRDRTTPRD